MFTKAEKATSTTQTVHKKENGTSFFRKAGEGMFFGQQETPSFFTPPVQAKLTVSSPDDPQEKEADTVAEQVMRMQDPVSMPTSTQEQLDKAADEEEVRDEAGEQAPLIQRSVTEQEKLSPKSTFPDIHRFFSEPSSHSEYENERAGSASCADCGTINRKSGFLIHRESRGPPATTDISFEQTLSSTKGTGSALPEPTRNFMESRFNADFSNVRIHTGHTAETMSRSINAQAFTHGSDIYFNSGKFSPGSGAGQLLLAHELTHTIQQGAVTSGPAVNRLPISRQTAQRKIQRSAGSVPSQLSNAVEHAKSLEGKINANKEGPDGYREGWEHLVEIFKSAFGEDKLIGSGGPYVPGGIGIQDIKKKRIVHNQMVAVKDRPGMTQLGSRDAMPSWCGLFVFWALNKGGAPMKKWELGGRTIDPKAAYPPGHQPRAGDIAYRGSFSHYAIVESSTGNTVRTVNGNTSGNDNLGAQVQTQDHPVSDWTGFFNPLLMLNGALGSGEGVDGKYEEAKSLTELQQELFNVQRKHSEETEEKAIETDHPIASEVTPAIQTANDQPELQKQEEENLSEKKEEATSTLLQRKSGELRHHATDSENDTSKEEEPSTQLWLKTAENNDREEQENHTTHIDRQISHESRGPPGMSQAQHGIIQRSILDDALSFAGSLTDCITLDLNEAKACALRKAQQVALRIPGYKALRVVLGSDPITGERIDRNGHNFIEAAFDIMPGGSQLHRKLNEIHKLDAAAAWIDLQISRITLLISGLTSEFTRFWNNLGLTDLGSPRAVIREGAGIVLRFIDNVIDFALDVASELLTMVKDFLLSKITEFIKERTPAYPLLTVILGEDPVTGEQVSRNGTNILNALLELGGDAGLEQRRQMQETGTFQRVAGYIDEGISIFSDTYPRLVQAFRSIWDHVGISSLMDPRGTFLEIYNQFAPPIRKVWNFVSEVSIVILRFIKEVLLRRLSAYARTVRGYPLLTVLLGKDPFTDEIVPRSMRNIIRGFMSLMEGGEEQFNQMEETGAIGRATAQIDAAVERLNMTPQYIVGLFTGLWQSFTISDLARPVEVFRRVINTIGEPLGRLIAFVATIVRIVIRVILEIMNFPFDLVNNIIARSLAAFDRIKEDPIGFLKNLLRAIKQGFIQFFNNIGTHLLNGVVGWLMTELQDANVPRPQDFTLRSIIGWTLEVLGISMEAIWQKLAAHPRIGPEKVARIRSVIDTLDGIWTFIKDVQERGIEAIWERIQEQLNSLWETVLSAVKNWVMERIITQITARLLSMLDPTGIMLVINSVIALYRAVQSFIRYLRQILEVINSFVNGIADIAEGNVTTAANYLESTMARAMPVVIGFLANQVGLSGIGRRIAEMIGSVRAMVDRALTWLVNRAVNTALNLLDRALAFGRRVGEQILSLLGLSKRFRNPQGETHTLKFSGDGPNAQLMIESTPVPLQHYISTLKTTYTSPEAVAQFVIIDGHIATIATLKADRTMSQTTGQAIQTELEGIARALQHPAFGGNENVPPSHIEWTPETKVGGSVGCIMTASPLSINPGGHSGSDPATAGETELWKKVRVRTNTYIQGHLLNHHVHGSGARKENLVPITGPFNTRMETSVETFVKNRVLGNKEVLHYRVEAEFPSTPAARNHIPEEGLLPTALKFKLRPMKKKDGTSGLSKDDWEIDNPGGPNLDNAPASMTHTLPPDTAPTVLAVLAYTDLLTEVNTITAGKESVTFNQFRTKDAIHERSVKKPELTDAEYNNLQKLLDDHNRKLTREQEYNRELTSISAMTSITTWNAFKGGRSFFDITNDQKYRDVLNAFNLKQTSLINKALDAADVAIPGIAVPMLWIDFKVAQNINFRLEDGPEKTKLTAIQNRFEARIRSLALAPVP